MKQTDLLNTIEAMVFISKEPLQVDEIIALVEEITEEETSITEEEALDLIKLLQNKYMDDAFAFELVQSGEGYCFMTKQKFSNVVNALLKNRSKKRLSRSALETLSIIAYRQPITKGEIEKIRGVGCDYAMKKLLGKELIKMKGKSDAIGRPMLYGTTDKFLEYFGISNLKDLPSPKEFKEEDLEDSSGTTTEEATSTL
ncbi:SMC-Scp complex subunit ScpB [Flammeovirga sp. MY04]|uniref:SMC-Scp complex subunit ScpB n=1 Tax=Flammeovirga sp. MY04 TaxID=1191459 RepID=UPI000826A2A8|nr:SMC-Scp complex subunit ScpB [Flammeovirga sp. MY04]ANQ48518.2 SMC-Scp complex subunit ScpB [Flammeovirga sp. MY04]